MVESLLSPVGFVVALPVTMFAFLKGDEPERIGAGAWILGLLTALLVHDPGATNGPQWGLVAVDVSFLAICAGLAWKSRRAWVIWACALQLVVVLARVVATEPLQMAMTFAAWAVVAVLAVGVAQAWRDRRTASLG